MVTLLLNPTSGRGRAAALRERLSQVTGLEIRVTESAGELTERARRAVAGGADRLLVAGGDGTLHHAIQGLAGSRCALGIVPAGRGNDLARGLDLPLDPVAAARRALAGRPHRIDLGRIGGRLFAGVAGIGFDGEVARRASRTARLVRGRWIYPCALVRTLFSFEAPTLSIDHDGGSFHGRAMLAVLANGPCYGGGMYIAPRAKLDDGWLELVIVNELSPLRLLALLPRVYRRRDDPHPAVRRQRVRQAAIRSDRPLTFYGDGEPLAEIQPAGTTVDVWAGALGVLL